MRKKLDAATQSSPDSVRGGFFYVLREGKLPAKCRCGIMKALCIRISGFQEDYPS
jgi:hypothetical protein